MKLKEQSMVAPKKILLVIPSLAGGGAERVVLLLMQYLDRSKFKPVLVVFHETNNYKGEIPGDVKIIYLKKRNRCDFFRLIISLSKVIKQENPSLILSQLDYTNYLVILAHRYAKSNVPLLITEQNNLTLSLMNQNIPWVKRHLIYYLYPKATEIVCVAAGVKHDLVSNFKVPADKSFVIYNSVDILRITNLAQEEVDHPWFQEDFPILCACGRLTAQKNYPLLLEAVKLAESKQPLRLMILGQGEEREKLESCAENLGISAQVAFLGFQANPFKYMTRSTIFVLSSSWEGLPLVVLEAMACGVPVISACCPYGPEEIITDGVNGLLVPLNDARSLADAIVRLLRDEPLRKQLAEAGKRRAEDFKAEDKVREYERVFEKVSAKSS